MTPAFADRWIEAWRRPAPRRPDPVAGPRPFRRLILVSAGENPSFDYYLAPRLVLTRDLETQVWPLDARARALARLDLSDALVLFCRYATPAWLAALSRAPRLAGAALLMDDDYAALAEDETVPRSYRQRLRQRGLQPLAALWRLGAAPLVSTPVLARLWAERAPRLLPPVAGVFDLGARPKRATGLCFAYHATAAHAAEQAWLEPVVRAVLAQQPDLRFEMVANGRQARRWRGEPRITVLPQSAWPDYRRETAQRARDLLVAPLLPSAANQARSSAKRIDAVRCGAALLVSDPGLYQVTPEELAAGMVAPLDPGRWSAALIGLARDTGRRERLARLNREQVQRQADEIAPLAQSATDMAPGWWRLS